MAARCAQRIALECEDIDSDKAYILGLLHNIGRKFGKGHMLHVSDGYKYMISLGYDEVAQICLTHSFYNNSTEGYIGNFDTTKEDLELIQNKLLECEFDIYDDLLRLCDALAGTEGPVDIIERMSDVKARYGSYPQEKWDANIALMNLFEKKMCKNIYDVVNGKYMGLLETTLNTRDLGGYVTKDCHITKSKSIFRSDIAKYPNEADIDFLLKNKITTIIDLRGQTDVDSYHDPFESKEQFIYYNDQIDEGSGVPESVEAVPHSYMKIAESKNMPNVFHHIANAEQGVLFHCSAGKDRSGVVSAILLLLADVTDREIIADYMLTKYCNEERFKLIEKNYPQIDMNIVTPNPNYMKTFLNLFREKYGSASTYLASAGLTEDEIYKLKSKLV